MKNFEELSAAIAGANDLAKSLAAPVDKIPTAAIAAAAANGGEAAAANAAASAEAGAAGGAAAGAAATETLGTNPEDELDEHGNPLVKSFSVTLDDGSTLEAVDASALLKSFGDRLNTEVQGRATDNEQFMKAFGSTIGLVNSLTSALDATNKALAAANAEIAALKTQGETFSKSLTEFGAIGRGRRSAAVVITPPPAAAAAAAAADAGAKPTRSAVLAKALDALNKGAITGSEATHIEATLNAGRLPEQAVLDRLFK